MSNGALLSCTSVFLRIGERSLIEDLNMSIGAGARLGIIGENGAGKSSLLALLSGQVKPTAGTIESSTRPAYVPQDRDFLRDTATVSDEISAHLGPLRRLELQLEQAAKELSTSASGAEERYSRILQEAEARDIWSAPQRLERYLYGLGLDTISRERLIEELSAGQRRRLAIALTIVSRPKILLLDEPSNYLDGAARCFLQEEILNWDGIVIFASHDREFLQKLPTAICDLDRTWNSKYLYGGAYEDYLEQKEKEYINWGNDYRAEQEEIRELQHSVAVKSRHINHHRPMTDRNKKAYGARGDRVQSQISRRVRAAREKLDRINQHPTPEPPTPLHLAVKPTSAPDNSEPLVAQMRSVCVDSRIASPVTFDIASDDKLLIVGPNGSGKTTILDVLAGRTAPSSGDSFTSHTASIGYLGHTDLYVNDERSPRTIYEASVSPEATRLSALGLLSDIDNPANELSVGQRKRLELAIVLMNEPSLLLFDELTNHLSLRLCEELLDLLTNWPTAVVIATHDPWVMSLTGWQTYSLTSHNSA